MIGQIVNAAPVEKTHTKFKTWLAKQAFVEILNWLAVRCQFRALHSLSLPCFIKNVSLHTAHIPETVILTSQTHKTQVH